MSDVFSITLRARWADMDFNAHMANSAYLDVAVEARLAFLESRGFPASEFARLRVGPIVMEDVIEYFAEVRLRETLRVTLELAGIAGDGSRFRFRNEIFREDGRLAARLSTHGAWFDLDLRKIVAPPAALRDAMSKLSHTADFADM
jgi:acyl-CoA thioester hydrolase